MEKLHKIGEDNIKIIKDKLGNSPDIIIREINVLDVTLYVIFDESLADKTFINNSILLYLTAQKMTEVVEKNIPNSIIDYLKETIPTHKNTTVDNFDDLFYNLLSGFTIVIIDGYDKALSLETRAKLDSGVSESKNETVIKGPKDAFTENYQTNIGLIRKRIRSEDLWLEEMVLGTESKTKVGIMYAKNIASKKLVDAIINKIKKIKIDGIFDSNYIVELISENKKSVFPNYISTERPDLVCMNLLNGRIAIIVENTQYVVVIPALFVDFFHTTEDYYQKVPNINLTRAIRLIALIIAILAPAIYIAITTYNIEAVPDNLLLSFASQREGVPLPTVIETVMMIITFEILRETDTRLPNAIGSSLSIVGAIVLGQAAVAAGIVSPITIIVVAVTSISGMITYNMDMIGGVRWWRFIFIFFAATFGLFGVVICGFLFLTSITSIKSFGVPFMTPFGPYYQNMQNNALFLTNKRKFETRNPLISRRNKDRQGGEK